MAGRPTRNVNRNPKVNPLPAWSKLGNNNPPQDKDDRMINYSFMFSNKKTQQPSQPAKPPNQQSLSSSWASFKQKYTANPTPVNDPPSIGTSSFVAAQTGKTLKKLELTSPHQAQKPFTLAQKTQKPIARPQVPMNRVPPGRTLANPTVSSAPKTSNNITSRNSMTASKHRNLPPKFIEPAPKSSITPGTSQIPKQTPQQLKNRNPIIPAPPAAKPSISIPESSKLRTLMIPALPQATKTSRPRAATLKSSTYTPRSAKGSNGKWNQSKDDSKSLANNKPYPTAKPKKNEERTKPVNNISSNTSRVLRSQLLALPPPPPPPVLRDKPFPPPKSSNLLVRKKEETKVPPKKNTDSKVEVPPIINTSGLNAMKLMKPSNSFVKKTEETKILPKKNTDSKIIEVPPINNTSGLNVMKLTKPSNSYVKKTEETKVLPKKNTGSKVIEVPAIINTSDLDVMKLPSFKKKSNENCKDTNNASQETPKVTQVLTKETQETPKTLQDPIITRETKNNIAVHDKSNDILRKEVQELSVKGSESPRFGQELPRNSLETYGKNISTEKKTENISSGDQGKQEKENVQKEEPKRWEDRTDKNQSQNPASSDYSNPQSPCSPRLSPQRSGSAPNKWRGNSWWRGGHHRRGGNTRWNPPRGGWHKDYDRPQETEPKKRENIEEPPAVPKVKKIGICEENIAALLAQVIGPSKDDARKEKKEGRPLYDYELYYGLGGPISNPETLMYRRSLIPDLSWTTGNVERHTWYLRRF